MAASSLCSVTLNSSNKTFFISILDVQEENGLIILDKLSTNSGNSILRKDKELKLSTCINGVQLSFNLKESVLKNRKLPFFIKPVFPKKFIPSTPLLSQNCNRFYFNPLPGNPRDIKITSGGYVFDFSRSGVGVNFYADRINIVRGDKLTNRLINLPDDHTLSFDLSVRSSKKLNPANRQKQVGYFDSLSPQNQKNWIVTFPHWKENK
jgi:hypothetical protein